jgi:hypothetical protein
MQKNRLADPSKICALDFKREFSAICGSLGFSNYRRLSVDFSCRPTKRHRASQKKTVTSHVSQEPVATQTSNQSSTPGRCPLSATEPPPR